MPSSLLRLGFVTNMPSYYQIEFFDAIASSLDWDIKVFYHRQMSYGRHWHAPTGLSHEHQFIPEVRLYKHLYVSPGSYTAIRKFKPDLLIVCQYASPAAQIAMWLHTLRGLPWVFWSEMAGMEYTDDPIIAYTPLRKFLRSLAVLPLRYASSIWGIGERAKQNYGQIIENNAKCFNLPYYSNLSRFYCTREPLSEDRKIRFLYSGSLSERKGFDILLEAIHLLIQQGCSNFEVVIAGKGPLETLMLQMPANVQAMITFMGFQQHDTLPEIYASCDVMVFPTRYDGWGMVVPEAMASGMPVIASIRAGATDDLIKDTYNGLVIDSDDVRDLSRKMEFFVNNPEDIYRMGIRAQEDVNIVSTKIGVQQIEKLVSCISLSQRRY
jgi:glycosyltransferase involved in cell wall biosynthesis